MDIAFGHMVLAVTTSSKFGSNYLGGKLAYQASHNTLNTKKAHNLRLKAFTFITD